MTNPVAFADLYSYSSLRPVITARGKPNHILACIPYSIQEEQTQEPDKLRSSENPVAKTINQGRKKNNKIIEVLLKTQEPKSREILLRFASRSFQVSTS